MSDTLSPPVVVLFADLLDALRRQGFAIGVDHYVRIYALLERVGDECAPEQLKTLICPLVATSKEQQEQFYRVFDQQFGVLQLATQSATDALDRDATETLPISSGVAWGANDTPHASASSPSDARMRWPKERTLLVGGVIGGALLIAALFLFIPRPAPPTSTDAPTNAGAGAPTATAVAPPVAPTQPSAVEPTPNAPQAAARDADRGPAALTPGSAPAQTPSLTAATRWTLLLVLLIVPLFGWVWYTRSRDRRRQLALRRERTGRPPFTWSVRVPVAPPPYTDAQDLADAARVVRTREASESRRLAVEETIAATIAAQGVPTFRYRSDTRSPDYLMLIERTGPADHHAQLFTDLASSLVREGVHITCYYHDGDPRVCFAEASGEAELLVALRYRFPSHRLLMFSAAERLVDPLSLRLQPWVDGLMDWRDRVLLTPKPVVQWGIHERVLSQSFIVLPASIDGLRTAGEILMSPDRSEGTRAWSDDGDAAPPAINSTNAVAALREYLSDDAFQWLCACALYPELNWGLTLYIASLPCMGDGLITESNLLRLIRLPWFRTGVIPDDIRLALINALPVHVAREVRGALVELLEQYPPPRDSVAASRYQLDLAMQRLLSGAHAPREQRTLSRALENVRERELLQDRVYIRLLEQDTNGPLALLLPKRLRTALQRKGARPLRDARVRGLAGAAALVLVAVPLVISWLGNRALAHRVRERVQAVATLPDLAPPAGQVALPSVQALQQLDALRATLDTLGAFVQNGPPLRLRFGFWRGQALFDEARPVWSDGFRRQLFTASWGALVDSLMALPEIPTASNDYGTIYGWLKSYLIITTAADSSTVSFLAPTLLGGWQRGLNMDTSVMVLARRQFEHYARELPAFNPIPIPADAAIVTKARRVLRRFTAAERVYRNLIDAGNTAVPPVRIPQFPGILTTTPEVPGAFSAKGTAFVSEALQNGDRYFSGETWVLGEGVAELSVDRAAVITELRLRYVADYTQVWLQVLETANVTRPTDLKDATAKLSVLSSNQSPLLQLLRTVALNTSMDSASRITFQPIHAITPPEVVDRFVSEKNGPYMDGLLALMGALQQVSNLPLPTDTASTLVLRQAALSAESDVAKARVAEKRVTQGFTRAPSASPVASAVERLLLAPITGAEAVLRAAAALQPPSIRAGETAPPMLSMGASGLPGSGGVSAEAVLSDLGRALCSQMTPMVAKFPFNSDGTTEASIAEVTALLAPGTGALWAFQQGRLAPYIKKQGERWVATPVGNVAPSAEFVEFFNRAAQVSAALFPNDAPTPSLRFLARGITSSQTPLIVLKHGGRDARFNVATPRNEIAWPAGREAILEAQFKQNAPVRVASATGEWALFRLVAQASRFQGRRVEWNATGKDAVPVIMEFEALRREAANVLTRGWLGRMSCVAPVTLPAQSGRRTLDSLTKVLSPESANEATARSAVPALEALLGRLATPTDSAWAYIRLAEAHILLNKGQSACAALRLAQGVARTANQSEVIRRYAEQLGCGVLT